MKVSIFIALIILIVLTGCFKGEGQIRIDSDIQNAIIYIDGDKKGMTGDGYTTIILEEGDHKVRIYKEKDEEWFYEGTQDVFVGENSSVKIKIDTDTKPTKLKLERVAKEKKEREERLAKEKKAEEKRLIKLLSKLGLSSYPEKVFIDFDTGLIWQDNEDAKTVTKNWSDAMDYCSNLVLGGKSDWRLPSKEELNVLYYKKNNLKYISHDYYLSSSTNMQDTTEVWNVAFDGGGYNGHLPKTFDRNVRCVRGGQ